MALAKVRNSGGVIEPKEIVLTELIANYGRNVTRVTSPIKLGKNKSIKVSAYSGGGIVDNSTITLSISTDGNTWTSLSSGSGGGYGSASWNDTVSLSSYTNNVVFFRIVTQTTYQTSTQRVWNVSVCQIE